MNTILQVAATRQRILGEEVEHLAREVGFIKRHVVLSLADFVQSLILGCLQEPEITLDGLRQVLERREVSSSAPGLSQRFTPQAATLLQRVLERLCAEERQGESVAIALLKQWSSGDPGREVQHHAAHPISRGVAGRRREPGSQSGRHQTVRAASMSCAASSRAQGSSRVDVMTSVVRWPWRLCLLAACMWPMWAFSACSA